MNNSIVIEGMDSGAWVQISALPLPSSVILNKSSGAPCLHSFIREKEDNKPSDLAELSGERNKGVCFDTVLRT